MSIVNLDELMKLRNSATPGPWKHRYAWREDVFAGSIKNEDGEDVSTDNHADAEYICAACNAVPELVARIKHLEAQLYEAVGYIISNESQSMIDCRICFFERYCERKKDQWKPDYEMCRKAIMHCITTEER